MTTGEPVDKLSELIMQRLWDLGDGKRPMSAREAARRAEGYMSLETFRLLVAGSTGRHRGRITDRTVEGLSRALQVPASKIYDVAGAPLPGTKWKLPSRFDRVPPAHRELLENLMAALLNQYDQGFRDALKQKPDGDTQTDDTP